MTDSGDTDWNTRRAFGLVSQLSKNNIAPDFGFDLATRIWSEDEACLSELRRLCQFARYDPLLQMVTLEGLDLRAEPPFDLSTAIFEDCLFANLKFPERTNFSDAVFVACDLTGVNLDDCIME